MSVIYYVSGNQIYKADNSHVVMLPSEAVEKYKRNIEEIARKKEWKTSGSGALFMGAAKFMPMFEEKPFAGVTSVYAAAEDKLIYAATLDSTCGLYIKNALEPSDPESYILRKEALRIFDIDYDSENKRVAASVSDGPMLRHLALFGEEDSSFNVITEGDSVDIQPSFSMDNPDIVYYSSAGLSLGDGRNYPKTGKYAIMRLDLSTGDLDEVLSDENHDYIKPRENGGKIYCIKRGKVKNSDTGQTLTDILLAPVKLIKAIVGFLNIFSQRYGGESIVRRSHGANPAKLNEKSEKEVFIEGNLINAEKTLKENAAAGDKYPGIAPKSWELISLDKTGKTDTIKKGVLDYAIGDDFIIYSNGKHIIKINKDGGESQVCAADIATSISLCINKVSQSK